jgi:hypothetical protein
MPANELAIFVNSYVLDEFLKMLVVFDRFETNGQQFTRMAFVIDCHLSKLTT